MDPPIFRLSRDLALRIFHLCGPPAYAADMHAGENVDTWTPDTPSRCLAVSHVCRVWREHALSDPLLWTTPLLHRPALARMMMARVRTPTLAVYYPTCAGVDMPDGEVVSFPPVVYKVLGDFARVQSLSLAGAEAAWAEFLTDFASPAPNLESLTVDVVDAGVWKIPGGAFDAMLPLPNLHAAKFLLSIPDATSPFLSSLTSLHLTCFITEEGLDWSLFSHSLDATQVLKILAHTPLLRSLRMECLVSVDTLPDPETALVSLPHLETLHIADWRINIEQFLTFLHISPSVDLNLTLCVTHESHPWDEQSALEEIQGFMRMAHDHTHAAQKIPFPCASIYFDACEDQFALTFSDLVGVRPFEVTHRSPLTITCAPAYDSFSPFFKEITKTTSFRSIVDLVLEGKSFSPSEDISFDALTIGFNHIPQLVHLTVCHNMILATRFLQSFLQPCSDAVVCPLLKTLRLLYCRVWSKALFDTLHLTLPVALCSRRADGAHLELLEIDERVQDVDLPCADSHTICQTLSKAIDRFIGPHYIV